MANEIEGIARPKPTAAWDTKSDYAKRDRKRRRDAQFVRGVPAPGEAWEFPAPPQLDDDMDTFSHTEEIVEEYSNYDEHGEYMNLALRTLPPRYYDGRIRGIVYYKGGTISHIALLEEAVKSGEIDLDESQSTWDNVRHAEKALIEDKAKPMFPWSTSLYSEDGQYHFKTAGEDGSAAEPAFYVSENGTRLSAEELAEELAAGTLPEDMPEDTYRFLWDLDRELCTKARMIGQAVRSFNEKDEQFAQGEIDEKKYLKDVHVYIVYFLGHDEGMQSAEQLRAIIKDPLFPGKALKGELAGAEPSSIYRRPVILKNAFEPPAPKIVKKSENS